MSRLQLAIDQIQFARTYTLNLLEHTKSEDWYRQPTAGISHIAWQVGHLAYAEFRLALLRLRGPLPGDAAVMPEEMLRVFGPDTVPAPGAPIAPAQIRATLDRVHARVLVELSELTDAALDEPVLMPHPYAKTKLLALLWCAHHEMLHAGQIGLLRRQLGYEQLW
jgi:hypothetical protein